MSHRADDSSVEGTGAVSLGRLCEYSKTKLLGPVEGSILFLTAVIMEPRLGVQLSNYIIFIGGADRDIFI